MHFWATPKLAEQIAAGQVPARDKTAYYVFTAVFLTVAGYAADWGLPIDRSWLHAYEGVVVCVITLAGAHRVVSSYRTPIDGPFFEMAYLLSVPLLVKTTLAYWAATYAFQWLARAVVPHLSADSLELANAIEYWLHRTGQLFPFVLAVVIAFVFWFRLAHHVAYVVSKRGA